MLLKQNNFFSWSRTDIPFMFFSQPSDHLYASVFNHIFPTLAPPSPLPTSLSFLASQMFCSFKNATSLQERQVAQKTPSVRLGLEDGKKFASGCAVVEPRSPEAFNKKPPRKPEKENLVQEEIHPGKVIAVPCPGVARVYSRCRRLRLLFADPSPGTLTRMN